MEIKMNKEIRDYAETMFFGLSLRQFLFSGLGCLMSIGIFFFVERQNRDRGCHMGVHSGRVSLCNFWIRKV